jgi:hypothetical protein
MLTAKVFSVYAVAKGETISQSDKLAVPEIFRNSGAGPMGTTIEGDVNSEMEDPFEL